MKCSIADDNQELTAVLRAALTGIKGLWVTAVCQNHSTLTQVRNIAYIRVRFSERSHPRHLLDRFQFNTSCGTHFLELAYLACFGP